MSATPVNRDKKNRHKFTCMYLDPPVKIEHVNLQLLTSDMKILVNLKNIKSYFKFSSHFDTTALLSEMVFHLAQIS